MRASADFSKAATIDVQKGCHNRLAEQTPWKCGKFGALAILCPAGCIPHICHFFTRTKFLENKIYTEKMRKLRQNTQKIANFLRYYGKIHSKLPIFCVKSVKIYTGQKKFTRTCSWGSWQISGMRVLQKWPGPGPGMRNNWPSQSCMVDTGSCYCSWSQCTWHHQCFCLAGAEQST